MGGPFALDFSAVLAVGGAQNADMKLLSDLLPQIEGLILTTFDKEDGIAET
ncbi:DUF7697 family protein [Sphingobium aromaticiconvertens]|uniref:DUF7697 family protein n=1 Tax=Sphingobium aromaticiconvertens TaxID=365341 RepID=UPI0030176F32